MTSRKQSPYKLKPASDRAFLVDFGGPVSEATERKVWSLTLELARAHLAGVLAVQPAFTSVLVKFNPEITRREVLARAIQDLGEQTAWNTPPREHVALVRYGGAEGPDLAIVAGELGLTERQVIELHTSASYRVSFLGFLPGFAYLGGLPSQLSVPRLNQPRLLVPRGSVGIAGAQTGIYPVDSPGGWKLIGRTSLKLLDWSLNPPALLAAGDLVRFQELR